MAIEFRSTSVPIPVGKGRRSINATATFGSDVVSAGVALNGFKLDYASSDKNLNVIEADVDLVSIRGRTVSFRAECNLADKNFDDPYSGFVTATVMAEVR